MRDIKSLLPEELREYLKEIGEPAFRADQIFEWVHGKLKDFKDMTNISKDLRDKLKEDFINYKNEIVALRQSADGTKKFLFSLEDGKMVECVLMEYDHGLSLCLSTQVGCAMACAFCASGKEGFLRNLTAGEIAEELYAVVRYEGRPVNHIVYMGMGEPLLNYDEVIKSIKIFTQKKGQGLSARHITLSTCGIIPGIERLSREKIPLTLALSLHASNQNKREELMPIAKKYDLSAVMKAVASYRETTGRRVTCEYALIGGVNDSDEDAMELSRLLKGDIHLNIIPLHEVEGSEFKPSDRASSFKKLLEKKGINVTIRRELGRDIDGACGQLYLLERR